MDKFFYWAEVMDGLKIFCLTVGIISIIAFIVFGIAMIIEYDDYRDKDSNYGFYKKFANKLFVICVLSWLITIFLPSKKTIYLMRGFGALEECVKNADAEKIPEKTIRLLDKYLEEELKKDE